MTDAALRAALRDLATIDARGQLGEVVQQHALECRDLSLPRDAQLLQPDADAAAVRVGRAAAGMLSIAESEAVALARDVLRQHPRRDIALGLIDQYCGRDQPQPRRRRAW